jgi:hypothetical protein
MTGVLTAGRLLRLYPRAWRDRYGEEFLATVGSGRLRMQQVIDIVSGAIDAWLSADVRDATRAGVSPEGGATTMRKLMVCEPTAPRYTTRDGLIGAGVMLLGTVVSCVLGILARRNGWTVTGEVLLGSGFMVSLTLSMPFWVMKGQPWKAQLVIIGGTVVLLIGVGFLASLI